jgi:hypothetical protein
MSAIRIAGNPADEELAALIAALATLANAATAGPPASPSARAASAWTASTWTDRERGLRTPLHPGPNAWRNSA